MSSDNIVLNKNFPTYLVDILGFKKFLASTHISQNINAFCVVDFLPGTYEL